MRMPDALVLAALPLLLAAAKPPAGKPVVLLEHPPAALAADARKLAAEDIKSAQAANETPIVLVGSAVLGRPGSRAALFVQTQSASLCGSAGCSTAVFLSHGRSWVRVLDSVSGPIEVAPAMHKGMHDLLVHGSDRWVWTGSAYKDTLPAPAIKLK